MKLEILGSAGGLSDRNHTSCAVIDGRIALDLGTGFGQFPAERILDVKDAVLTHSHIDHITLMCFWIDRHAISSSHVTIHCLQETADALRTHVLNNTIWPNMEGIKVRNKQCVTFHIIEPFKSFAIGDTRLTPLPLEHGIPTLGYCLHGANEDFVYCADMIDAPDSFWAHLKTLDNFKRMVMEISFDNDLQTIARLSSHLTPDSLKALMQKHLPDDVRVFYNHTKTQCTEKIAQQVAEDEFLRERVRALLPGDSFEL